MENQGETREMMKDDIQQLRSQMSQILEALNAMQNPGETCTPQQQHMVQENPTCPPSSLPSNYTPPPGVDSRKVYIQNVENSAVDEENKLEANTFTCSRETTHPDIMNIIEAKQHEVKYVAAPGDVKDEDSKLEMLEKRLTAIEGERNFAFSDAAGLCLVQDMVIPPKFKLPEFEYARRWREIVAQVVPPLPDKEMATMFIDTLESPFYERMVSNVSSSFADLVIIGERIEIGVKTGKIAYASTMIASVNESSSKPRKMRDGKAQSRPTAQIPLTYPHSGAFPGQNLRSDPDSTSHRTIGLGNVNQDNRFVSFAPIPMTYATLLPSLLQRGLASICPMKLVKPPYPKTYDADTRCDYHGGAIGHSTENCWGLKCKVQSLIDS